MNEFVQAHATYRFVVVDEEDDRPRILIWLFKPNMRLSYTTPSQFLIPKSGSIRAAKVLFKLLAPSTGAELHACVSFLSLYRSRSRYPVPAYLLYMLYLSFFTVACDGKLMSYFVCVL